MKREGELGILRLERAHGNAINQPLVEDLIGCLDRVETDPAVRGILLESAHPRIFCPGLDIQELVGLDRPAMGAFLERFAEGIRRLFAFSRPVVAALSGHAVAGGCLLALCADYRVLQAEGAMVGLNEVRLGVPLPWGAAVVVRHAVPPSRLAEAVLLGRNFSGAEAVAAGLAHELAPAGEVGRVARERLREFAAKEPPAFASLKRSLRSDAEQSMRTGDAPRRAEFLDVWFSPPTRALLDRAVRALREREQA